MIQREDIKEILGSLPISTGAIAGIAGTIPMTIFMLLMHRLLPNRQQYALPPQQVTEEVEERASVKQYLNQPQIVGSALVSHFSYGASMGTLYMTLTRKIALPAVLKGALFGLIIWAASYLGWMPPARFPSAATEEPVRRNALMIVAHLIWGAVTGWIADELEGK